MNEIDDYLYDEVKDTKGQSSASWQGTQE